MVDRIRQFLKTLPGGLCEAAVYAIMLLLIFVFFTGNGQFIYEAF